MRPEKPKRFLVRTNCEYTLEIEACDAAEAEEKAEAVDIVEWNQAWSPIEAEEE